MRTADFDYVLPPDLVAQQPAPTRDQSRLLVLERASGKISHRRFTDLPDILQPIDLLILNDSKVIPARLHGRNVRSAGEFEVFLLEENSTNDWWAMLRPAKRAQIQTEIHLRNRDGTDSPVMATVEDINAEGHRRLRFRGTKDLREALGALGDLPLPPYIKRPGGGALSSDFERYQTVYARVSGSVAAPTAGLHFTPELLERVRARGLQTASVTLHVGYGTFAPVKVDNVSAHRMHQERFSINAATAELVNRAKAARQRILAVGTSSLRVLESAVAASGRIDPVTHGNTRLFVHPPHDFRVVDRLLTNFHLPCSTLLMLVSAFASPGKTSGREMILAAYAEAIRERYRFYSYGDAMLIL